MRTPRFAACVVALGVAGICSAQPTPASTPTNGPTIVPTPMPTPWAVVGPEFPVNTTTSGSQFEPGVAVGADDGFVVVWSDFQGTAAGDELFARRFDKAGFPLGSQFPVNGSTTGNQHAAAVASDASGNFVVVWSSGPDASGGADVFARRFDSGGNPLGPEFMVNTYTTGFQGVPRIAMHFDGDFVVVWDSSPEGAQAPQDGSAGGIFGRRYDAAGAPLGGEFQVNTYTTGYQFRAAVDMRPFGDFTVVWASENQDGNDEGIFGQLYDPAGTPVGAEFQVNSITTGYQGRPDISMNENTGFVVTWSSYGPDGSDAGVFGRLFNELAEPVGIDFQINNFTPNAQSHARVFATPNSQTYPPFGFLVVWDSFGQDDPGMPNQSGIFAQRFNNAPSPTAGFHLANAPRKGVEYQVNSFTTGDQFQPAVAVDARGQFVIVWGSTGQDGSESGIVARRFGFPDPQSAAADQRASSGTSNLNGVLEPGETVAVDPSWRNPAATPLDLESSIGNLTGPPGPSYSLVDSAGDYGQISAFQTNTCFDCFELTVTGARPVQHWDATMDETLTSTGPLGPLPARTKTWALHVGGSFADVPSDVYYPFIENIFHNRVTAGGGCGAGNFCGEEAVLRQQMAVFLLKARTGAWFVPPPATGAVFDDVPASNPFAPWIEELARLGVTGGCAAPPPPALPSYCPTNPVNRQQMAVFLLKTFYGSQFSGGGCGGTFDDVPCTNPFAPYVEYLTLLNIAAGCQASPPLYCPTAPTLRRQMAVFLVKTFSLTLYGPD